VEPGNEVEAAGRQGPVKMLNETGDFSLGIDEDAAIVG